jgi:hypothetical protein
LSKADLHPPELTINGIIMALWKLCAAIVPTTSTREN